MNLRQRYAKKNTQLSLKKLMSKNSSKLGSSTPEKSTEAKKEEGPDKLHYVMQNMAKNELDYLLASLAVENYRKAKDNYFTEKLLTQKIPVNPKYRDINFQPKIDLPESLGDQKHKRTQSQGFTFSFKRQKEKMELNALKEKEQLKEFYRPYCGEKAYQSIWPELDEQELVRQVVQKLLQGSDIVDRIILEYKRIVRGNRLD